MIVNYISLLIEGIKYPAVFLKNHKELNFFSVLNCLLILISYIICGYFEYHHITNDYNLMIFHKGLTLFIIGHFIISVMEYLVLGLIIKAMSMAVHEKVEFLKILQIILFYSIGVPLLNMFVFLFYFDQFKYMFIFYLIALFIGIAYLLFVYFVTIRIVIRKRLGRIQKAIPGFAYLFFTFIVAIIM